MGSVERDRDCDKSREDSEPSHLAPRGETLLQLEPLLTLSHTPSMIGIFAGTN